MNSLKMSAYYIRKKDISVILISNTVFINCPSDLDAFANNKVYCILLTNILIISAEWVGSDK